MVDKTIRIALTIVVLVVVAVLGYFFFLKEEKKKKKPVNTTPLTSAAISNLVNTRLRLPSQPVGEAVAAKLNSVNDAEFTKAVMGGDGDALIAILLKINGVEKMPAGAKVGFLVHPCPSADGTTFYAYDGLKNTSVPPCPTQ